MRRKDLSTQAAFCNCKSVVEFVYEKNKYIFPITLLGALINIGLNYLMIPFFGYKVAAYTTFVGYLIIAISHYVVSRRIIGNDVYGIRRIIGFVSILFIGALLSLFLYHLPNIVRYICILIVIILLCLVIYRNRSSFIKAISKKTGI